MITRFEIIDHTLPEIDRPGRVHSFSDDWRGFAIALKEWALLSEDNFEFVTQDEGGTLKVFITDNEDKQ